MQASTTVVRTKKRPVRFLWIGPDGVTPNVHGSVPLSSEDNSIAQVTIDPNDNRRALIQGMNEGTTNIWIGNGSSPLVISVTVTASPDLSRFELVEFEPEE